MSLPTAVFEDRTKEIIFQDGSITAVFKDNSKEAVFADKSLTAVFENKLPTIVFSQTKFPPLGGFPYILPYILS